MNNELKLIEDFTALAQQLAVVTESLGELLENRNTTGTRTPPEGKPARAKEDEEAVTDSFKKMVESFNKNH